MLLSNCTRQIPPSLMHRINMSMAPRWYRRAAGIGSIAMLLCLALSGCARYTEVVEAASKTQSLFEFRSSFWGNLHHVLYESARRRLPPRDGELSEPLLKIGTLGYEERAAWDAAVSYYYAEFIIKERDLLLDESMQRISDALSMHDARSNLANATTLPPALLDVLRSAAPVYRQHWWDEHDRVNRQLASDLASKVAKYGLELRQQLASTLRSGWPQGEQRLQVEVVHYANWAGAYTFTAPTPRITLASSSDERSAAWRKLELLFHEASHTLIGKVAADIDISAQRLGKEPEQLWHATLFFSTGEVVRRTLEADGIADYVPYAYYNGMFAPDSEWRIYARSLEKHWQPYLQGEAEYQQALDGLVGAMPDRSGRAP
jgi:hypothetical protein